MISVQGIVFFIAALLLLVLPLDWLIAVVIASVFHELCHIFLLYALKGRIHKIRIKPDGCVIETDRRDDWKQFVSILAGPVGSFSLLLLSRTAPKVAICGLLQGMYNLLPVSPLDGGRLLRLLLDRICPKQADFLMGYIGLGVCAALDLAAIWLSTAASLGIWPVLAALLWNIKFAPKKNSLQTDGNQGTIGLNSFKR